MAGGGTVKKKIYIVDDEPKIGNLFVTVLKRDGFEARSFVNPVALFEALDREDPPDVVLADLMMPDYNGIELIEELKRRKIVVPVIIMTAHSSVKTAVEAMRLGAYHYLQKPVNLEEMRTLITKALQLYEQPAQPEVPADVSKPRTSQYPIEGILGDSEEIHTVRSVVETLRNVPNTTVLIRGETGTGKNLVAKTIHHNSAYNAGRFMEINCAALPDNLLEAELFGYEKGAFTDARASKPGLLELADGGTLFLDEIDSMSVSLQAKLLSFLESRMFRRLGGVEELRVTTRILCATNADLEERVAGKEFRKDLFYRINVINIHLPPLRRMGHDVLRIADVLLKEFNSDLSRTIRGFAAEAQDVLTSHTWPGNVRELRNVIERAVIFTQGDTIHAEQLTLTDEAHLAPELRSESDFLFREGGSLEDLERAYIGHVMKLNDTSYAEIARILGISKKTLWEKRKRYNLDSGVQA
jgi:two-component system, NtrC family, response regulator AtoC